MPEERHENHEGKNPRVQAHGNHLCPAEVFILRPNLFHLHRLAGHLQRRKLRWRETLLDAVEEAAKARTPVHRQPAVDGALGHWARTQKFLQIVADTAAKGIAREWCVRTLDNLYRALGQKLLQIRPKIIRYKVSGSTETWHSASGHRHGCLLRGRFGGRISFYIRGQEANKR